MAIEFNYKSAHQYSDNHRKQVIESSSCGYFYCLSIFEPSAIQEWIDNDENSVGQTALCPHSGVDSVIGNKSGVPINNEFLEGMHKEWF